jgi:hypothetical protein
MIVKTTDLDPQAWAEENFGELELGHAKRNQRAITTAAGFAANPGKSIPQTFGNWYQVQATYTFFANPEVTPDELQARHRELTMERLHQPGVYLLVEDTTEPSWGGKKKRPGLGRVGDQNSTKQGFHLHTSLAVRWPDSCEPDEQGRRPPVELIGIADQQSLVREAVPKGETRNQRLSRARESEVWEAATTRIGTAPEDPAISWIRVCDRGADIYEFLCSCLNEGHGYVVRAAQDRALVDHEAAPAGQLFATARRQPSLGEFNLELRARPGQAARSACLSLSATSVSIRSPWRPGHGLGKLRPIQCTVVRVWEANPLAGVEPLEWILLCEAQVTTFDQVLELTLQYATRWLVEEFHKAIKTGMGVEKLQLETGEELMAAVALMSVVALRLLHLREIVRIVPEAAPEASGLCQLELDILTQKTGRSLLTVRDVALALGRLGGHLNRKSDGLPGWITLWRGYVTLQILVEGVRLAHKLKKTG